MASHFRYIVYFAVGFHSMDLFLPYFAPSFVIHRYDHLRPLPSQGFRFLVIGHVSLGLSERAVWLAHTCLADSRGMPDCQHILLFRDARFPKLYHQLKVLGYRLILLAHTCFDSSRGLLGY